MTSSLSSLPSANSIQDEYILVDDDEFIVLDNCDHSVVQTGINSISIGDKTIQYTRVFPVQELNEKEVSALENALIAKFSETPIPYDVINHLLENCTQTRECLPNVRQKLQEDICFTNLKSFYKKSNLSEEEQTLFSLLKTTTLYSVDERALILLAAFEEELLSPLTPRNTAFFTHFDAQFTEALALLREREDNLKLFVLRRFGPYIAPYKGFLPNAFQECGNIYQEQFSKAANTYLEKGFPKKFPNLGENFSLNLTLSECSKEQAINQLRFFQNYTSIKTVQFLNMELSEDVGGILSDFPHLKTVVIHHCQEETDEFWNAIARIETLRKMRVEKSQILNQQANILLKLPLRAIEFFECNNISLTSIERELKENTNLQKLAFVNCPGLCDDAVAQITRIFPLLTVLGVSQCENVSDRGFASIQALSSIKTLIARNNPMLTDQIFEILRRSRVQKAALDNCPGLTYEGLEDLAASENIDEVSLVLDTPPTDEIEQRLQTLFGNKCKLHLTIN